MRVAFAVSAWSAIAPDLRNPLQWMQWAQSAYLPEGDVVVELPHIPAMSRRRLGHLAKMAVTVADEVLAHTQATDIPVVWASRYGDADKSIALLQSQAIGEPLSPTGFGLSVHNGVGAQHSILRGMRANAICVASSYCAPEAGVVEALGLLHEGASEVLLVCYDSPLPGAYSTFHDEAGVPFAWALLLTHCKEDGQGFVLQALPTTNSASADEIEADLPHGLDVLHFLLHPQRKQLLRPHATGQWLWERPHA